ncbi:MAG: fluoride efflux transporter CrcB [Chloroflexota bacterium]
MDYLWVGLGGFIGASARHLLGNMILERLGATVPWHTFVINMTGSLLIGALMTLLVERSLVDSAWRPFVIVGFLGGYTTFSSYTFEAIALIERGAWGPALAYTVGSNAIGLLATLAGMTAVRALIR